MNFEFHVCIYLLGEGDLPINDLGKTTFLSNCLIEKSALLFEYVCLFQIMYNFVSRLIIFLLFGYSGNVTVYCFLNY